MGLKVLLPTAESLQAWIKDPSIGLQSLRLVPMMSVSRCSIPLNSSRGALLLEQIYTDLTNQSSRLYKGRRSMRSVVQQTAGLYAARLLTVNVNLSPSIIQRELDRIRSLVGDL